MTAKEFIAKFPHIAITNTDGTLEDIACPNCGERDCFRISAQSVFRVRNEGTEENEDVEWDDGSACWCVDCSHGATVADFTIKGLDEALEALAINEDVE